MKLALVLATLALAAPLAHADALGFVDVKRVYDQATEPQRVQAEIKADHDAKEREINAASQAVTQARATKGAKATDVQAAQDRAAALAKKDQDELTARSAAASKALSERFGGILTKLRAEKRMSYVLPVVPLWGPKGADLTDEVIRRWNAQDVAATAKELSDARAENAALKARLATAKTAQPK